MVNISNDSNCLSVDEGRVYIVVNSFFASLGSLANLVTIFLIVFTAAHKQYVHRLTLYLAVLGLIQSVMIGLEVLPADTENPDGVVLTRSGWENACAAIGFVTQHIGLSKALIVLYICLFLFMLAICNVRLQSPTHEAVGILSVFLLPALTSWVPFVGNQYGLIGVWCWIKYDCVDPSSTELGSYYRIGASVLLDTAPHTLSIILVSSVAIVFWKRSCCDKKSRLRQQHWVALKEVSPLVSYPVVSAVALFFGMVNNVIVKVHSAHFLNSRYLGEMVTLSLMQVANLAIPISFVLHPSVRRSMAAKFRAKQSLPEKAINESTMVHPAAEDYGEKHPLCSEGKPLSSSP